MCGACAWCLPDPCLHLMRDVLKLTGAAGKLGAAAMRKEASILWELLLLAEGEEELVEAECALNATSAVRFTPQMATTSSNPKFE